MLIPAIFWRGIYPRTFSESQIPPPEYHPKHRKKQCIKFIPQICGLPQNTKSVEFTLSRWLAVDSPWHAVESPLIRRWLAVDSPLTRRWLWLAVDSPLMRRRRAVDEQLTSRWRAVDEPIDKPLTSRWRAIGETSASHRPASNCPSTRAFNTQCILQYTSRIVRNAMALYDSKKYVISMWYHTICDIICDIIQYVISYVISYKTGVNNVG